MKIKSVISFILIFTNSFFSLSSGQISDSTTFSINTRLSFYSFEKNGEFLLHIPPVLTQKRLSINITAGQKILVSWTGIAGREVFRIPFTIDLAPSVYKAEAKIVTGTATSPVYAATTDLVILPYKTNEVKTDRFTGGLIVNKRKFFPFGFYCYSPVYPTLQEEEVVKGFNTIAPYQKILPETLNERKAYMDRSAELGMKVHYNLLSVSGGGGVGSKIEGISDEEKRARLISEIKLFMDHPALLGWYISDEPTGNKISPEQLEEVYRTVKELDPWHPVSIVFMAPFLASKRYSNAVDIVMADPYPIPDLQATMAGDVAGQLKEQFRGKKPVWIVPQAFGGGELWSREPTIQEIRSMTWQSIIKGATGIQYFVRQGLNYFPKSAAMWSECGRMAVEVGELTPWLLSDEESLPVQSYTSNISILSKIHNNQLIIMAVNKTNAPAGAVIRISGINNSKAKVLFENRSVAVSGGLISDHLSPFGSEVYLINLKPEKSVPPNPIVNLVKDPGFEDITSPGIPSACYARPGGDRGATYFLDTREAYEGNHSLRIVTPQDDKSMYLRFFPFRVKAGASYVVSIWAKSDPEQRFLMLPSATDVRLTGKKLMPQYVEMSVGEFSKARFVPDSQWRRFVTFVTIPTDTLASFKTNLILKMPGQGVAWFDEIKVFEEK